MNTCRAFYLILTTVLTLPARAEKIEVVSNDSSWRVDIESASGPKVGEPFLLKAEIFPNRSVKGCPALKQIIFDMPQHGHGSDYASTIESLAPCMWRISGLTPTMVGAWRLRLVLAHDAVATLAEIRVQVK